MPYEAYIQKYPHLGEVLEKVVQIQGIKNPRVGIIHDLNPNAFTFGHTKNNARIILTDGILHYLDKEEQKAVLAHELGHVVHSDFILMTVVFAIPLILLTIARWAYYARWFSGGKSKDSASAGLIMLAIAAISYISYIIGYLISLIISRIREYYADEHSAEVLENPNALSTALVKIGYGLVKDLEGKDIKERNKSKVRATRGLGIFDPNQAKGLAIASVGKTGTFSKEAIEATAAWDLFNPWAKYYQIYSTHPLPAKRIQRLNEQCKIYGIQPEIDFSDSERIKEEQAGKSLWGEFLTDLFIKALPTLIFLTFVVVSVLWLFTTVGLFFFPVIASLSFQNFVFMWFIAFYLIGFGFIIKIQFMYRSGFEPKSVVELLTNVKVSPIRCEPAIIEGKIIGRGIPGYYFSDDIYFEDDTGLLYIDYRFGVRIVDFFWSIMRVPSLIGQKVRIKGWYRRGPSPYIQVDTINAEDGRRFRNYTKHLTYFWAVLMFIIGGLILFGWLVLTGIIVL
jgi:Zn-dependent protease with chaperone function